MAAVIVGIIAALVVVLIVTRTVRIVPQARAANVERLGRYIRTLQPGLNVVIPFVDRVRPLIDVREQVVSFEPQSVITEDNLSVNIDTVLYYQVTSPRDAAYEIGNFIQAIEKLTATTLRNVIGSLDLEKVLVSREHINSTLRGVLDDASGKWGIRVTRVELKAIEPPPTIKESMEKQMRADREKRAAILNAEGNRQSRILNAQGERQAAILKAEGQSKAIDTVFSAVHRNDPDPKLLAYQYLQVLPELAKGEGNTFWVIPSEVTQALQGVSQAFSKDGLLSGQGGSSQQNHGGQQQSDGGADDEQKREQVAAALAEAAGLGGAGQDPVALESQHHQGDSSDGETREISQGAESGQDAASGQSAESGHDVEPGQDAELGQDAEQMLESESLDDSVSVDGAGADGALGESGSQVSGSADASLDTDLDSMGVPRL